MHGEEGFISACPVNAAALSKRLVDKIEENVAEIGEIKGYQLEDAQTVLLSFGISSRSARRAMTIARGAGKKVGLIQLSTLWPFPAVQIRAALAVCCNHLVVVELNMGQLALEVERLFSDKKVLRVNKWSGEDILPREIVAALEEAGCQ